MTKPSNNSQQLEMLSIAQQAEDWHRILKTGGPQEKAAFWAWVEKSPVHAREILVAVALDSTLDHMDPERKIDIDALIVKAKSASNVAPLERPGFQSPRPVVRKSRIRLWSAIAAGTVGILLLTSFAISHFYAPHTYTTSVGEQRMVKLKDGSIVFLNTESRIRTDFSADGRDIYLSEGQALFQVKHDGSRPFRVHADTTVIQALGTQFDVRRYTDRTSVAVVEGVVAVIPDQAGTALSNTEPQPLRKISAGQGATISSAGKISVTANIDPEAVTAWRNQQLDFRNDTLEFIASEFNRYNSVQFRVDANVGMKRFDGMFNARSPESFLLFLRDEKDLEFDRRGDEITIRARSTGEGAAVAP